MALLAAARCHWTEFRGRRVGDKTRHTGKDLVAAFVSHVPASERLYAATREAIALYKKLKSLWSSNGAAWKKASGLEASTAEKERAGNEFDGAVLFGMANF